MVFQEARSEPSPMEKITHQVRTSLPGLETGASTLTSNRPTSQGESLFFPVRAAGIATLAIVMIGALFSGCYTRSQGESLEAEIDRRLVVLEKQLESDREEYTKLIQKAEGDVTALEEVLTNATGAAATYAADTENMREEFAKVEGGIAELRNGLSKLDASLERRENSIRDRMELIASKVGLDPPLDPAKIPQEPAKLLTAADSARQKNDHGKARSLYRAFMDRFPTDERADDVQLKIGQSYAEEGRHAQALTALNVIVDRYPTSDVMGETLFSMASSLYNMRSCNDAITLLQAVLQRYRDTALTQRTRTKLREVQRAKRRGCRP